LLAAGAAEQKTLAALAVAGAELVDYEHLLDLRQVGGPPLKQL
jgi:hypothetical protein